MRTSRQCLVLDKGRLVQDGAPDTLLRGDGIYRKLMDAEMRRLAFARPRAA